MAAVNVLVLEDKKVTRRVIGEYLSSNLSRDASEKDELNPDAVGGQLAHLLPDDWEPFRPRDFKVCAAEDGEIDALIEAAQGADRMGIRRQISSICVEAFAKEPQLPDVLVVDLALSEWEQGELMAEEYRWPTMICPGCNSPKPDSVKDPRSLVQRMTGYKVIGALTGELPIIATSYSSHPLVSYCCRVNGAGAFVRKPVRDQEHRKGWEGWDWVTVSKYGVEELERCGQQAEDPLAAVVLDYLTTLTAQILAALPVLALGKLSDCGGGGPCTPVLPSR